MGNEVSKLINFIRQRRRSAATFAQSQPLVVQVENRFLKRDYADLSENEKLELEDCLRRTEFTKWDGWTGVQLRTGLGIKKLCELRDDVYQEGRRGMAAELRPARGMNPWRGPLNEVAHRLGFGRGTRLPAASMLIVRCTPPWQRCGAAARFAEADLNTRRR